MHPSLALKPHLAALRVTFRSPFLAPYPLETPARPSGPPPERTPGEELSMLRSPRWVSVLLITAALATGAALAAPLGAESGRSVAVEATATDGLARLRTFLAGLWSKNGCHVDPNGRCLPAT